MQMRQVIFLLCVVIGVVGSTSHASDQHSSNDHDIMVLKLHDNGNDNVIRLDSDHMGFNLSDLQEGETRNVVTEDGRSVTITKVNGEISLGLPSGKTVQLPFIDTQGDSGIRIMKHRSHGEDHDEMDFDFSTDIEIPEGLTISSSKPLDDNTKQVIQDALSAAGIYDPINFSDHPSIIIRTGEADHSDIDRLVSKHKKVVRKIQIK